jgi:hypothetical protein
MSDEEKKPRHPEINFLPPLNMVLTFFNKKFRKRNSEQETPGEREEVTEENVENLIEKLSEKEE